MELLATFLDHDETTTPYHRYPVKLFRHKKTLTVRYGLKIRKGLCYTEAAKELGECIMHAIQCTGTLDGITINRNREGEL